MCANRLRLTIWGAVMVIGSSSLAAASEPAMHSIVVNSKVAARDAAPIADDDPAPRPKQRWSVPPRDGEKPLWRSPKLTVGGPAHRASLELAKYPVRRAAAAEPLPPGRPIAPRPDRISIGDPSDGEVIYEGSQDDIFGDAVEPGETYYDGPPATGRRGRPGRVPRAYKNYSHLADDYAGPCGDEGCESDCEEDCCWRVRYCIDWCVFGPYLWENASLQGGVQAFKGPVDRGANGNFGFHEGFNWAVRLGERSGLGFQLGGMAVHSDLSGTLANDDSRTQFFVTSGVFRRATDGWGWQGGAVVDYQHDDFLVSTELAQLRAELSYLFCCRHELGVWIAVNSAEDRAQFVAEQRTIVRETADIYAGFYRHYLGGGGYLRGWGGATSDGEGIIGGDAELPLCPRWSLATGFNYRLPNEDTQPQDARQESWGLSISLVWYPFRRDCRPTAPFRPLFNVADNATFFVNQR